MRMVAPTLEKRAANPAHPIFLPKRQCYGDIHPCGVLLYISLNPVDHRRVSLTVHPRRQPSRSPTIS
ncbi:hypothetical protein VTJ04DRAFT_448 [Mycothermus thermophilus]|uniref:uncharacterized protein n=1 Tax=Humicola insolens TaxID=85995 RepID=UPI00374349C1